MKLPLFDKDSFLEALFQSEGVGPPEWRRSLSARADAQFQRVAMAEPAAVLTSWWKHPASTADSGTPIGWLTKARRATIEVHCSCSPAVAAAHFLARRRHRGHLDERWSHEDLLAMLKEQHGFGPLFPVKAIAVNTEQHVDIGDLVRTIRSKAHAEGDAYLV